MDFCDAVSRISHHLQQRTKNYTGLAAGPKICNFGVVHRDFARLLWIDFGDVPGLFK
jgi:hypothetical protein